MFSPFAHDLLRPELSSTFENLVRRPASERHFPDIFPNYGTFLRQDRNLGGCRNMFQLFLNVRQFKPEEIEVKVVDDFIVVHGKHDEVSDEHGLVSREFTRKYKIPADVDPSTVRSVWSSNGVLLIKAPKKVPEPAANERIVPIEIQRPTAVDNMDRRPTEQPVQVVNVPVETPTNQ